MPHRDDLEAAHARIAALERELKTARGEKRARLRCARCGTGFEPDDLDRARGHLTCRRCRTALKPGRARPSHRGVPRGLDVDDTPERLRIEWRWRIAFAPLIGLLATVGLLLGLAIADVRWSPLVVFSAIVLGALALVLAYMVAGQVANRTTIVVADGRLRVETAPIAIPRVSSLSARDIDQLYCVMGQVNQSVWYTVYAQLVDGRRVRLADDLTDATQAFFLEREIESRLGIVDRPVRGEVARRDG